MPSTYSVRPATRADGAFLGDMIAEAVNWRPGAARPKHDILSSPEHSRYLAGWMRPSDAGFVALAAHGEPIGAAWYRILPRTDPSLAHVGTGVPEMVIGVRPIWRAHGVGRLLLQHLAEQARAEGYARLCLSVERGNFATTLYRSEGFAVTQPGQGRDIMIKRLR